MPRTPGPGFYDGLTDDEQRELRATMTRRRFSRGEIVFHQGDPGAALHIIESGWFLVEGTTNAGDQVGMNIEGPRDVFGELAMVDTLGKRTATVRALRPAATMSLDGDQFEGLRERFTWVDRFLVTLLAWRVERLSEQLAETAWLSAEKRVCRHLDRLIDVFDDGPIFLKQAEIASLAQTTRPTVSSVLGELSRAGIVETKRGSLVVLDRELLKQRR